jgi:hypothetical protein
MPDVNTVILVAFEFVIFYAGYTIAWTRATKKCAKDFTKQVEFILKHREDK